MANPPWWAPACGTITATAPCRFSPPLTSGYQPKTPRPPPVQKTKAPKTTIMNPRHPDRLTLCLSAALLALSTMGAAAQQTQQPAAAQPAASQNEAGKANGAASESANGQSQEEPDTLILSDT